MAKRRRRKILIISLIVLAVIAVLGPLTYYFLLVWQLRQVIAETDGLDPGWRLEDILASRDVVPEDQNSARVVADVAKLLPETWPPSYEERDDPPQPDFMKLDDLRTPNLMDPELAAELEAELEKHRKAIGEARTLAGMPKGRYRFPSGHKERGEFDKGLDIHKVSRLLAFDAVCRAHRAEADEALASCRAMVGVARSVGDDPRAIAQSVRLDMKGKAIVTTERVLSQGQASLPALRNVQEALEAETRHNEQRVKLRGDRGIYHEAWSDPGYADESLKQGSKVITLLRHGFENFDRKVQDREQRLMRLYPTTFAVKSNQAHLLRAMNRAIEIANQPYAVQLRELDGLEAAASERFKSASLWSLYSSFLGDAVSMGQVGFAQAYWKRQAELRCAIAALAVERFRIEQGKWPESLAELVPRHLGHVPEDPFAERPLKYRRLEDGVVVYSVGRDGVDHAGRLPRHTEDPWKSDRSDLGFRLWDPDKRRQPARPPKPSMPADPKFAERMKPLLDKLNEVLKAAKP